MSSSSFLHFSKRKISTISFKKFLHILIRSPISNKIKTIGIILYCSLSCHHKNIRALRAFCGTGRFVVDPLSLVVFFLWFINFRQKPDWIGLNWIRGIWRPTKYLDLFIMFLKPFLNDIYGLLEWIISLGSGHWEGVCINV